MNKNKVNTIRRRFLSVLMGTLLVVCLFGCGKDTADYVEAVTESESVPVHQTDVFSTEETVLVPESEVPMLYVYICGQVQHPGVYQMSEGSRICDIFEAAGGLTPEAAFEYWNQARPLTDGEMIYVPTQEEAKERSQQTQETDGQEREEQHSDSRININTATKEELMTVPGIGESKALAIIAYREEHGGFSAIEDIMKVAGVKEGVFAKIKDYIVVN